MSVMSDRSWRTFHGRSCMDNELSGRPEPQRPVRGLLRGP
jgi:hypothetical protein